MRSLLIGYGNPWRGDDGLGPELVRRFWDQEHLELQELSLDLIEDLASWDAVVFVDAALDGPAFELRELGDGGTTHSPFTHHISPEELCQLTEALYGRRPRSFLLSIRGYEFDFGEGLSPRAQANLARAEGRLRKLLAELARDEVNAH